MALESRVSRRVFLRSTLLGGTGLVAAHLLACREDGRQGGRPTITPGGAGRYGWRELTPPDPPPIRRDHSLVTDGERVYLFGGRSASVLGDHWVYTVQSNTWRMLSPTELSPERPAPRFGHNAVWLTERGSALVFGGQTEGGGFLSDLWEFAPATGLWSLLSPGGEGQGPPARYGAAGAADSDGRLIISHGFTSQGRFKDTWRYDPATAAWSDISVAPEEQEQPIERCLMRGVWDTLRNRLIMFGGQTTETPFLDDLWVFGSTGWQRLPRSPHPTPRNLYAMVYDDNAKRAVLFGGQTEAGPVNDLWVLDAADEFWIAVSVMVRPPSRAGHDAVWLPSNASILMFGGNDGASDLNDLWQLTRPASETPGTPKP